MNCRSLAPFTLIALAASLALAPAAQAKDLQGRTGLGVSTAFGPYGYTGPSGAAALPGLGLPGLSLKFQVNDKISINPGASVLFSRTAADTAAGADAATIAYYTIGARVLATLVQESTTNFYFGGGAILTVFSPPGMDMGSKTVRIPAVFGVELFFSKASSFAVSAEGGLEMSYHIPDAGPAILGLNTVGGIFNIGFHYYFAAKDSDDGGGGGGGGGDGQ